MAKVTAQTGLPPGVKSWADQSPATPGKNDLSDESVNFLKARNLTCWNFLNDGTDAPMVFGWMPAIAIYFPDPDGHVLEFIGILNGEGKPENGIISYERWLELEKAKK